MTRLARLAWALGFVLLWAAPASAKRRCDPKKAAIRFATGSGIMLAYASTEYTKGLLDPAPRWTDPEINAYDRLGEAMRWQPETLDEGAASLSDVLLGVGALATPGVALLGESPGFCLVEDVGAIYEGVGVAALINQSAKFLAKRERPFTRDLSPEEEASICADARECTDLNLSFYSGHASWTASLAGAAFAIAAQRQYKTRPAVVAFGGMTAVLTAYLRVAAGKHYLSDVTVGLVAGAAIGYAVPTYVHPLFKERAAILPTKNGLSLVGSF